MSLKANSFILYGSISPYAHIVDGVNGRVYNPLTWNVTAVVYAADIHLPSKKIVFTQSSAFKLFNTDTWAVTSQASLTANGIKFNHAGTKIALVSSAAPYMEVYNSTTFVKDAAPGALPTSFAFCCEWSPDDSLLIVGWNSTPYFHIYNTADWTKVANPASLPAGRVVSAAFSPDGALLALQSNTTPYILLYTVSTWTKLSNPSSLPASGGSSGTGSQEGIRFSPDGTMLAIAVNSTTNGNQLVVYKVSTWAKFTMPTILNAPSVYGTGVIWESNAKLFLLTSNIPTVVEFSVNYAAETLTQINELRLVAGVNGGFMSGALPYKLDGTIEESLAADTFTATAYDFITKDYINSLQFTGTTFSIPLFIDSPVEVTVSALEGNVWEKSKSYSLNALAFPTNPINTPYYYKATTAGISSASEPVWPITAGGTVTDGTVVWTRVERLIEPVTQGPLIPQPA